MIAACMTCFTRFCHLDVVTLRVVEAELNVTELDDGEITNVSVCFTAMINPGLNREVVFELVLSNSSTATINDDFYLPQQNITIPYYDTYYNSCIYFLIIGDMEYEENEDIVYTINPLAPQDNVMYGNESDSLVITILDDDGKSYMCQSQVENEH